MKRRRRQITKRSIGGGEGSSDLCKCDEHRQVFICLLYTFIRVFGPLHAKEKATSLSFKKKTQFYTQF
jgi:hypothetical protein